ncbi:MAG: prephenate dehydrogenase [Cyclobacteriaceae bacterium]|nr:MAG: prephenate dehydrogenase [Cyclobacteriaceae bacterium]
MRISIVGLGLIGGSMALDLKASGFATEVIGVDISESHCQQALQRNLVDRILPIEQAIDQSELIILAMSVHHIIKTLPQVLDQVESQVVIDVGSTKQLISEAVKDHPKRANYLGTHPMAGTEFSGPQAALKNLFRNKVVIFCDVQESSKSAILIANEVYDCLRMPIVKMTSRQHDKHVAYVSHISHISSFALALTVLKKEKDEQHILNLASGGFDSTVRLAKSNPEMWSSIFVQNSENAIEVLDNYVTQLKKLRKAIESRDLHLLNSIIMEANKIKKIL